jgi:signal peptidase I
MRRVSWILVGALALMVAALSYLGCPAIYYMTGPSMEPTIAPGRLFLARSPPGEIARGDLVLFRFVDEDGQEYHVLRRVAGLAGDTVAMRHGRAVVNGVPQPWPFRIMQPQAWRSPYPIGNLFTWGPRVVPPDSVFLLADTRDMVGWPDSRFIGFVARADLVARATRRLTGQRLR